MDDEYRVVCVGREVIEKKNFENVVDNIIGYIGGSTVYLKRLIMVAA